MEKVNTAIDWAVKKNLWVIYIQHNNLSAGTRTFKPGTRGAELVPEMNVVSEHIFTKTKSNALTSEAFTAFLQEHGITDFELKAVPCDGIEACKMALMKKSRNVLDGNFIEGMACTGGCIGGAGCLTHGEKNKAEVDKYGREALEKTITDAISLLK